MYLHTLVHVEGDVDRCCQLLRGLWLWNMEQQGELVACIGTMGGMATDLISQVVELSKEDIERL